MTHACRSEKRVLAIDPTSRGFGFAVLEGPERLIDWGVKEARVRKKSKFLRQLDALLTHYQPDALVVEDHASRGARRCARIQALLRAANGRAAIRKVKIRSLSRAAVRRAFASASARTKQQIALAIANHFPELTPRIPPPRKPWMSEDYRMSIFDAVALGLTLFHLEERRLNSRTHNPSNLYAKQQTTTNSGD